MSNDVEVFNASTGGGKYRIVIVQGENEHGTYYDVVEYTQGRESGFATFNTTETVVAWTKQRLHDSATIDGINYKISKNALY